MNRPLEADMGFSHKIFFSCIYFTLRSHEILSPDKDFCDKKSCIMQHKSCLPYIFIFFMGQMSCYYGMNHPGANWQMGETSKFFSSLMTTLFLCCWVGYCLDPNGDQCWMKNPSAVPTEHTKVVGVCTIESSQQGWRTLATTTGNQVTCWLQIIHSTGQTFIPKNGLEMFYRTSCCTVFLISQYSICSVQTFFVNISTGLTCIITLLVQLNLLADLIWCDNFWEVVVLKHNQTVCSYHIH